MTELIETFIRPLNEHGIRYMITGSVASMVYGEPRLPMTLMWFWKSNPLTSQNYSKPSPKQISIYHLKKSSKLNCCAAVVDILTSSEINLDTLSQYLTQLGLEPQWQAANALITNP